MEQALQWILLVTSIVACCGLLIAQERILRIAILAIIFLIQFVILIFSTQWMVCLTLLILGWMSCAVLGTGKPVGRNFEVQLSGSEATFRLLTYLFFSTASYFLGIKSAAIYPNLDLNIAILGIELIVAGVVVTAFARPYYDAIFGLLVVLAGFEMIYYSLEMSLLVVGLMGGIKLGIGFLGSYWFIHYSEQEAAE
jgi:hypothetical protein